MALLLYLVIFMHSITPHFCWTRACYAIAGMVEKLGRGMILLLDSYKLEQVFTLFGSHFSFEGKQCKERDIQTDPSKCLFRILWVTTDARSMFFSNVYGSSLSSL